MEEQLGTMTDKSFAELAGVRGHVARRWRIERGIAPHRRHRTGRALSAEQQDSLILSLGTVSDIELASEYGVTRQWISVLRRERGIACWRDPAIEAARALIGQMPVKEISEQTGLATVKVHRMRREMGVPRLHRTATMKLDRYRPLMGKISDHEIGRRAGMPPRVVQRVRAALGIPAFGRSGWQGRILDYDKIEEMWRAGAPDVEIAAAVGSKNPASIAAIRHKMRWVRKHKKRKQKKEK
tara:strand:+ start:235 stop:954 length:720 start_codon:yes stop_codon:yes gene_type:complete